VSEPVQIIVVGQTPPPFHGQSLMIRQLLDGAYESLRLHHVRMAFSGAIEDIGRPGAGKILHLIGLIARILAARFRTGARVLYYPPGGRARVPMWRDIAILTCVRWTFHRTVFHFHACGISELRDALPAPARQLFDHALGKPDLAIHLSGNYPQDGDRLGARRSIVIPNGIRDAIPGGALPQRHEGPPRLLSLGIQSEEKGTLLFLEMCRILRDRGVGVAARIVGGFHPAGFRERVDEFIGRSDLESRVMVSGPLSGGEKWDAYRAADIFCFPSRVPMESFGIVLLEAMQFGLPCVASRWRAAPDIVVEGETGFLAPPDDPAAWADLVEQLLRDPDRRVQMGRRARARYEAEFTEDRWRARMAEALHSVAPGS
jgi:glycosyltransferase involved in cell wall biosynthesis